MTTSAMFRRGAPMVEMTGNERRLVDFLLAHGSGGRWSAYQGSNLSAALALHMDWSEPVVRRAIAALQQRQWISEKRTDDQGRPSLYLNSVFAKACQTAVNRRKVRSALGYKHPHAPISDADADVIFAKAEKLTAPVSFKERIRKAAKKHFQPTLSVVTN